MKLLTRLYICASQLFLLITTMVGFAKAQAIHDAVVWGLNRPERRVRYPSEFTATILVLLLSAFLIPRTTYALESFLDFNSDRPGTDASVLYGDAGFIFDTGAIVRSLNSIRYVRQNNCQPLTIMFSVRAGVHSVSFDAINRHRRAYVITAFSSSQEVDSSRYDGPNSELDIEFRREVTLQSEDAESPITRVVVAPPHGCFDEAGLDNLKVTSVNPLPFVRVTEIRNPSLVPLHQWWNREAKDNRLSSEPSWQGSEGSVKDGYRWVGVVGYIYSAENPQPEGTDPLYTWHSPSRSDYKTISHSDWQPGAGDVPRRQSFLNPRLEGYVLSKAQPALAGTLPLQMHYNAERAEFDTTTRFAMLGQIGSRNDGYVNQGTQGYVIAPRAEHLQPGVSWGFGLGKVRYNSNRNQPMAGAHKIVMVRQQFSNVPSQLSSRQARSLILGPGSQGRNINGLFREMSGGKFSFQVVGNKGPYTILDNPATRADERNYNCNLEVTQKKLDNLGRNLSLAQYANRICPRYVTRTWDQINPWTLRSAVRQLDADFDFSLYDTNRDGTITNDELSVFVLSASVAPNTANPAQRISQFPGIGTGYGGIVRDPGSPRGYGDCIPVDGVRFCASIGLFDDGAALDTIGHELFHLTRNSVSGNDIYGSGSKYLSLMSDGNANETDIYHLDPWHKMRLGWNIPQVRPISTLVAPSSATLKNGGQDAVLFTDPARAYGEYFMAEHRGNQTYDRVPVANTKGVHFWYAKMRPRGTGDSSVENLNPQTVSLETGFSCPPLADRRWNEDPARVGHTLWSIGFLTRTNCIDQRRGGHWTPLTKDHSWTELRYYPQSPRPGAVISQGQLSGLKVTAGPFEASFKAIDLEWKTNEMRFLPRIDSALDQSGDTRTLTLNGDFGLQRQGTSQEKYVRLKQQGVTGLEAIQELPITSWSANEIVVSLPEQTSAGTYELSVFNPQAGQVGNHIELVYR